MACLISACSLALLAWLAAPHLRADPFNRSGRVLTVMDSVTGVVRHDFRAPPDASPPFVNPGTGDRTLFLPERCHAVRGSPGLATRTPTFVILNEDLGRDGPTRCPDCGRAVTRHNKSVSDGALAAAFAGAPASE
ncbi:MAG: hypothetical protein C0475_01470 [Planctomyces sp.]|nr:hypothetical protein [Planctomyces sp.]MBA4039011.1 hypothetical protein [Planctomyces sp.]MBA4119253.1 hypothetical protein [Isosphaera sp.]